MDYTDLVDFVDGRERNFFVLHNCVAIIQVENDSKSIKISVRLTTTDPENFDKAKELLKSNGLSFAEASIEKFVDEYTVDIAHMAGPVNLTLALINE